MIVEFWQKVYRGVPMFDIHMLVSDNRAGKRGNPMLNRIHVGQVGLKNEAASHGRMHPKDAAKLAMEKARKDKGVAPVGALDEEALFWQSAERLPELLRRVYAAIDAAAMLGDRVALILEVPARAFDVGRMDRPSNVMSAAALCSRAEYHEIKARAVEAGIEAPDERAIGAILDRYMTLYRNGPPLLRALLRHHLQTYLVAVATAVKADELDYYKIHFESAFGGGRGSTSDPAGAVDRVVCYCKW